jgi:hypothetical protein
MSVIGAPISNSVAIRVIARPGLTRAEAGILGHAMCMQCMTYAITSVGAAGGIRAWVASRSPSWMTPRRLRMITAALLTVAVLAAGIRP